MPAQVRWESRLDTSEQHSESGRVLGLAAGVPTNEPNHASGTTILTAFHLPGRLWCGYASD
jgi:hypothetical protein